MLLASMPPQYYPSEKQSREKTFLLIISGFRVCIIKPFTHQRASMWLWRKMNWPTTGRKIQHLLPCSACWWAIAEHADWDLHFGLLDLLMVKKTCIYQLMMNHNYWRKNRALHTYAWYLLIALLGFLLHICMTWYLRFPQGSHSAASLSSSSLQKHLWKQQLESDGEILTMIPFLYGSSTDNSVSYTVAFVSWLEPILPQ